MLGNVPGIPPPPRHTHTHNDEKYWIHVCIFPCKKEVRRVSLHLHVKCMYEWIKLSIPTVKYVGIEVHPSSRRRVYLKTRPVADVRCQPLLAGLALKRDKKIDVSNPAEEIFSF